MSQHVVFKPQVTLEPLVNSWYAWPMLIYPASLALITRDVHLKLMESYVKAPQFHLAAARNPELRGGPFLDYGGPTENILEVIARTRESMSDLLALAGDLSSFHGRLEQSNGSSLESLYAELPPMLRGLVELRYDTRNSPSMRLIEPLVYARFDVRQHQSLRLLAPDADDRPFCLSSPRPTGGRCVDLQIPFCSSHIEALVSAKSVGIRREELRERLITIADAGGVDANLNDLVMPAESAVHASTNRFEGDGLLVRYFGHACVLVSNRTVSVLIDPIVSPSVTDGLDRFSFADLPEHIDYVLLTHNHQDHVLLETLLQIRHRIGTVVVPKVSEDGLLDPSLKRVLRHCGFDDVIELGELDELRWDGMQITGIPFLGEHGDLGILGKLGYCVRTQGASALFLADSNNLDSELYRGIAKHIGHVDAIFLGMECAGAPMSWLYGSLLMKPLSRAQDQSRRLNGSNAARALELVECWKPAAVCIYAMGAEPWLSFISSISYGAHSVPIAESNKLVHELQRRGIDAERLYAKRELHIAAGTARKLGTKLVEPFST